MNIWQEILRLLTFGLYNPEKKFEQEVLGEATTNLEEIENLRTDVENAVTEFNKYFPAEHNKFNKYELYNARYLLNAYKNSTVSKVIETEEELQKEGKYVGMDEETRIKAILSEGKAAQDAEWISIESKANGEHVSENMLDAIKISRYQAYMNDEEIRENGRSFNEILSEESSVGESIVNGILGGPRILVNGIQGLAYTGLTPDVEAMRSQADTEKYIAMILADDRATRQNDGTHSTKTSEEWARIDTQRETELREMPQEELLAKGQALEESLQARYDELTASKEGNER